MTLIHSSHERKTVSVSNSAKITKIPEITAIFVAVESRSNRRAHGEMHNQRPSSQLHQSSHCFGSDTAIVAPFQNWVSEESIGQNQSNADEISADIAMSAIGPKQTWTSALQMSAFEGKADMTFCGAYVR